MNNKIFKKKSSFYLFGALACLLVLVCVGGFFVFNALAAPKVAQGRVEISCSSRENSPLELKSYTIHDGNENEVFSKKGDTKTIDISGSDQSLDLYIFFENTDNYGGNVNGFSVSLANIKIYTEDESASIDYGAKIEKTENVTHDGKNAKHVVISLPKLDTTAVIKDKKTAHHAKLDVKFDNKTIYFKEALKFNSVSSNYDWVDVKDQFSIFGYDFNEIPNGSKTFRIKRGTTDFSFYVKPSNEFKNSLETMRLSATHTSGNKSYNYQMMGLNNSNDDRKIFVDGGKNEYVYRKKIFKDKNNNANTIKYDILSQEIEANGKKYKYNGNMKVFVIGNTECVRDISLANVANATVGDVTYTFDKSTNSFKDSKGNVINFNQYRKVFIKDVSNECYKYDTGNSLFAYQSDFDTDDSASAYNYELEKSENGEYYVGSDGKEYIYSNQKLVSTDGTKTVDCVYRKFTLKLFELDEDNQLFDKGIQSSLNVNLKIENIFNNSTRKITVNKGDDSKSVDLTDTKNVEVKIAIPNKKEEAPSYNENYILEKTNAEGKSYRVVDMSQRETVVSKKAANNEYTGVYGEKYTCEGKKSIFRDSDGNGYVYDTVNKTFTGKDGVTYTYNDGKFKGSDGVEYKYDETNKIFAGKDGIDYVLIEGIKFKDKNGNYYDCDETSKTFRDKYNVLCTYYEAESEIRYEIYKDVSVPYNGSVYIYIAPTVSGWYSGSGVTVKLDGESKNLETSTMEANGQELGCYKINEVKSDITISVSKFELKNLRFNINFNGAPEGTSDRVRISVSKDNTELTGSNGTYSGIDPNGFVCKIYAGRKDKEIDERDVDLENIKYEFSGSGKISWDSSNGKPEIWLDEGGHYIKFKATELQSDITLNITSVPFKTINVKFYNRELPDEGGNTLWTIINDRSNKKADIYLKGSTTSVTSFSSGQAWNFDLNFLDNYESDVNSDGSYKLVAELYDGNGDQIYIDGEKFTTPLTPKSSEDGRIFSFEFPGGVRGYKEIRIVFCNVLERRMSIQYKVAGDMVNNKTLNDFKIDYINSFERDSKTGAYVPTVTQTTDGIYNYVEPTQENSPWSNLNEKWEAISGDSSGDVLSNAVKMIPYNGILVFRITLKDDSKLKYIIDKDLPIAANGVIEKKVINPQSEQKKKEYCSCVQVVIKGNNNGGGIKEDMTGKSGSISIGKLESSSKEVTFKFFGKENETELDPSSTHAGNILEKVSVYKIDDSQSDSLSESELYDARLLYQCTRNENSKVENTKNSYMLNYKKDKNTIAVRAMQGIDVDNMECHIMIDGEDIPVEKYRTVDLSIDDNNGYIVIFKIPDECIDAFSPEGIVIEFKGVDIKKYAIALQGFDDVGVERKLSSESEFKEVTKTEDNKMSFSVDYGEDFEIKIIGSAKDSYEGLFNRITLASGALFLKEGTQSGGTALQKNNDGSFTYTFFVYKVKSDSTIKFSNVINKVMLDFDNVDGIEFYECSSSEDSKDLAVLEDKKIQGKISCAYGTKYSFAVKASTGYNLGTFHLITTVEGSEAVEEKSTDFNNMFDVNNVEGYKIYTLKNGAQKSTTISGTIKKEIKTVTFAMPKKADGDDSMEPVLKYLDDQGNEVSSMDVDYGSNVAFSVSLSEKYSNSSITVELYKKGDETLLETLHTVSGYYKITNITENYEVRVSGCTVNNYFVNFSKNDHVDYLIVENGEDKEMSNNVVVSYGGSCYFKVKEKEGYQMGENAVVQATSASGQKITLEKNSLGQYKLTNIKDNYTITVENIDDVFYNLKFITVDGVTYYNEVGSAITGDFKVGYGKNFEFSIKVDDAHSESLQGAYIVTNESGQSEVKIQKLASDRYLIQNITQDITIRVANVSKNKYTITLTKDEGIDYYNKDGKVITGENEVEYGGSLSFKVSLYPLYANSNIKVMLGNQELSADNNEFYTVETVTENKTVTVAGIGKTDLAEVIETINSLPTDIKDDTDLEQIIQAVRDYNNLSDAEKSNVGNYYVLEQLQKKVADIIHTYNGVTAEGLDWNIKLIANPIDTDIDACTRIYGKLNSEYILSLYDVYLWDTLTERRYTLPEGKSVVIHLPTPNMAYFENPSGVHENSDGKLNFLSLNMGNSVTSLETSSLSPIGIIASRSSQPGRSSLIDAIDSNVSMLTNYSLGNISGSGNKKESNYSGNKNNSSNSFDEGEALTGGSNSEANKFRKTDNSTTRLGSALKLILIIMILLILIAAIWAIVKKYKDKSKKTKNNDE